MVSVVRRRGVTVVRTPIQPNPPAPSRRSPGVKVIVGPQRTFFGRVIVSRHAHRTVVAVTSVRPKPVALLKDYSLRRVPGIVRVIRHGIQLQPGIDSTGNVLVAPVNTTESWQNHFATRGWASIQDQIDAGYPIYAQPNMPSGRYQEVFDFGSVISNIIVIVNWNTTEIVAAVSTAGTTLETSSDGITWSAPTTASSVFAAALRYVRVTMNFTPTTDKSLALYYTLQCLLNVHREQDGGQASVFAADAGGTVVTFNKAFKAIDSITLTPVNTVEQKAIYDFAFPPNPTSFKILLFNAAGARIDGTVTWLARGIF